jgi:hypothetical protein
MVITLDGSSEDWAVNWLLEYCVLYRTVAVLDAVAIVFYAVVVQYCIFAQCFFLRFSLSFAEFSLYIFLARVWKGRDGLSVCHSLLH